MFPKSEGNPGAKKRLIEGPRPWGGRGGRQKKENQRNRNTFRQLKIEVGGTVNGKGKTDG